MVKEHFQTLDQLNPLNIFIELYDGHGIQKDLFGEVFVFFFLSLFKNFFF